MVPKVLYAGADRRIVEYMINGDTRFRSLERMLQVGSVDGVQMLRQKRTLSCGIPAQFVATFSSQKITLEAIISRPVTPQDFGALLGAECDSIDSLLRLFSKNNLVMPCKKCDGVGRIGNMGHVQGGVCFRCNGTGSVLMNLSANAYLTLLKMVMAR